MLIDLFRTAAGRIARRPAAPKGRHRLHQTLGSTDVPVVRVCDLLIAQEIQGRRRSAVDSGQSAA